MRLAVNARLIVSQRLEGMGLYTVEVIRQILLQTDFELLMLTDRAGDLPELPRRVDRQILYPSARHPVLFAAWFELRVPAALEAWRADAFLSADNFTSLRTKVPQLLVVHDLAYLHQPEAVGRLQLAYYRYFMPRFARRAEALVTVSDATRRDVAEAYDIDPADIRVAYNGVRPRFAPLSVSRIAAVRARLTEGAPYFVYVGAVHPRKNVDGLIRAYSSFRQNTAHAHKLLIAGRFAWQAGPTRAALESSPFRADVHLLGYVEEAELGEVIGAATGLALVSHFEGFGVPVLEALTCGVPVVASASSSLPEVAGPGGLLVDPADDDAIAEALARLAGDDDLCEVLAKAGRQHAEQFTWARAGAVIVEALRTLYAP